MLTTDDNNRLKVLYDEQEALYESIQDWSKLSEQQLERLREIRAEIRTILGLT